MKKKELNNLIQDLKRHLRYEQFCGGDEFISRQPVGRQKKGARERLEALQKTASRCQRCPLSESRRTVVFGSGNPYARLVFIGEAPGYDEDVRGLPFVGKAGQLLTKIIESISMKRKDVYICNILKCRPPNNRNPLPSEISACHDFLAQQLAIIKPRLICALGKVAAQRLLETTTPISLLRGKFYDYAGTKLIPTYHPAYLLRNPRDKRLVWEDMKKIRRFLKEEGR